MAENAGMKASTVEAHQFTALSCITVVMYGLISISCTHEPWKICLTKTKNDKSKTPRPVCKKNCDCSTQRSPKNGLNDTHQKRLQYFENGPKFCKTHVIQGTILYPCKSSICTFASSNSCTTCVFRKSKRDRNSQLWSCSFTNKNLLDNVQRSV